MNCGRSFLFLFNILFLVSPSKSQYDGGYPPVITKGPGTDYVHLSSGDIPLVCEAAGVPIVTYTWLKNGEVIDCTSSDYICKNGIITSIKNSGTTRHEGYYQCLVTNAYGSTMSDVLRVRMYISGNSNTTVYYRNFDLNSGNSLPCNAPVTLPSLEDRSYKPDAVYPKITWGTSTNANTSPVEIATSTRVQIHARTALEYFGPYLLLANVVPDVGLENEAVVFQCFFAGRPTPIMTSGFWRKVNGSLPTSRVTFSDYFTKMRISNLQPSDAGVYRCEAPGYYDKGYSTLFKIEAVPRFNSESDMPYSRNVTEGDTVTIKCNPYAIPKANILWYRNTELLNPINLPPKFTLNADQTELTISNVCRECGDGSSDLMSVQCNVTNQHGFKFVQGYLNVVVGREESTTTTTTTTAAITTTITTTSTAAEATTATATTTITTKEPTTSTMTTTRPTSTTTRPSLTITRPRPSSNPTNPTPTTANPAPTTTSSTPTTPTPSNTPGTVICYNCEGRAFSSCGINVDTKKVVPVFCMTGYCATVIHTSTTNSTISKVVRSCGRSDSASTNCATYGPEMMCVKTCNKSFCNRDITVT